MFRRFFKLKSPHTPALKPTVEDLYATASDAHRSGNLAFAVSLYEQVIALQSDHAEACYKCANALKDLGQLELALARYDDAISRRPAFSQAWCNRGVVLQSLQRHEAALASYDRAINLDPADAIAHTNRGLLLQVLARWQPALASYDQALALEPRLSHVWFHRGNVLREMKRLDAASASYAEAIKLKPDYAEAHYNLGVLLEKREQASAALASYDRAIAVHPDFYHAHFNRAGLLKNRKDLSAALAAYERTLNIKSDSVEALSNKGVVLQELGRWAEALRCYEQAIQLQANYAEGYFNRGNLFASQRQWDMALVSYDRTIALKPDYAAAYCERGRVLMEQRRVADALANFKNAVQILPDFAEGQYNLSLALLLSGDYKAGWPLYEWRWKNAERLVLVEERDHDGPLWLGRESVERKRVLLHCEQGLGDTLQFCRFAKSVAGLGATVILEVQSPLETLLASLDGVATIVVNGKDLPEFDYRCPLLSLPMALGTTLDTIPAKAKYLYSDPPKVAVWRSRLQKRRRPLIGIAWSGNPKHGNDHNRSCSFSDWIGSLPAEFGYVCLQKDVRPVDLAVLSANPQVLNFISELKDFSDTAALCDCLDLIVSVDTSVAHLSAALGKPTWILLPYNPDWRWLLDRQDSPWYPTVRLYRQERMGDWQSVYKRVAADLRGTFDMAQPCGTQ